MSLPFPVGLKEYVVLAAIVALILHALIPRYVAASLAGAVLCSIGKLVHGFWPAGFPAVQNGWVPFLFIGGLVVASPVCFVVGLPFICWRWCRRLPRKDEPGEAGLH
jgi:hypothetical protein